MGGDSTYKTTVTQGNYSIHRDSDNAVVSDQLEHVVEWFARPIGKPTSITGVVTDVEELDGSQKRFLSFPETFPRYNREVQPDHRVVLYQPDMYMSVSALFGEKFSAIYNALKGQQVQVVSESFHTPQGVLTNGSLEILTGDWKGRIYAPRGKLDYESVRSREKTFVAPRRLKAVLKP